MFSIIVVLLIVVAILGMILYKKQREYRQASENSYNMAFYEVVDYVQNVETYLAKALISTTPEHGAETLTNLWREANLAQSYLSMLPIESQELENTEKFLNQGITLLKKALDLSDKNNRNNIALDLANAYNGLGVMMLNNENRPKAIQLFDKSQEILNSVIKEDSKNGRAHFLLSVTYFYKSDLSNAKREAKLALNDNFKLPEEYLEELNLNMTNPAGK